MRHVYFSAIIAVIGILLSWLVAFRYQWTGYTAESLKECQLVIGILSARGNFEQRQAIRDTWLRRPSNATYCVRAYFVVGQNSCQIPPEDRLDEFDCKPWEINLNEVGDAKSIHFSSVVIPSASAHQVSMGLRFQVQHPIVVTKLGVLGSYVQSGRPVTAILQTTATQDEVARVTLSPQNVGTLVHGYFYRPIEPLILPKGFEGSVFLSEASYVPILEEKQCVSYNDGGGLLSFQQTIEEFGIERSFDSRQISAVSLGFTLYDLQALKLHVERGSARKAVWDAKLHEESSLLRDEMFNHDDLLIVNAVDVYRNLPLKLLLFYQWVREQYNFGYMMKTDDDCVLNLDNITRFLNSASEVPKKLWWGRFRYNWVVQRSGKWREVHFGSMVYPPFACGVANVMTSDIVQWAAKNQKELHNYQGEDVSVGIWLSAIAPTYIHDTTWQCDEGCQKDALSRGQLNPEEIRRSWAMFAQCGQFCSCDIE